MSAKEVAKELLKSAQERHVRFPKIWDDQQLLQECGMILMAHRDSGEFKVNEALEALVKKHGVEEVVSAKRKSEEVESNESKVADTPGSPEGASKKAKRVMHFAREENRGIGEAIMEMASIYFKNSDPRKGGVFSKAAKAIREAENVLSTKKDAMALPGVGKGIAGYMEEFWESGMIKKLEELRAGIA